MLYNTKAIALRTVKFGETSLIATLFTEQLGVKAFMVKGVRSSKGKAGRAAQFQAGSLLEVQFVDKKTAQLDYLKEYNLYTIYTSVQEDIIKSSIAVFSVEFLLRLLPEHAEMQDLFRFCEHYFRSLDQVPSNEAANYPLFFVIQCGRFLGFDVIGSYSEKTPVANFFEGQFTDFDAPHPPFLEAGATQALSALLSLERLADAHKVVLNASLRNRILDWLIAFIHQHTQHLTPIKSLGVLQTILH